MARQITALAAIATMLSSMPALPATASPQEYDLVGSRAPGAESEMGRRGYSLARNANGAQYWWNGRTSKCVRVVVADGRYASVTGASDKDCGKGGGSDAGAIIAGVAAVGLIAALASHKKQGGDSHSGTAHDSEYERGYNDGLYGAAYDRNDSEPYHSGYIDGSTERNNRVASNSRYVRGAPRVAQDACARRADQFQNAAPGSSVVINVYDNGQGNYQLTMATGPYRSRCNVTASGYVQSINPY